MLEVLDRPAAQPGKTLRTLTWQATVLVIAVLLFMAFVLWLTASHFDQSEFKTLMGTAVGAAAREYIPIIRQLLKPTTDMLSSGGQLE